MHLIACDKCLIQQSIEDIRSWEKIALRRYVEVDVCPKCYQEIIALFPKYKKECQSAR